MGNELDLDISLFPRELRLMLAVLAAEDDSIPCEIGDERTADMDWNQFLQFVNHHRVYPLIYAKLSKLNEQRIPDYVMQEIRANYSRNTFKMLYLSSELDKIGKLFDSQNIRSLMLKGPVLAEALYGQFSLRTSKDLDVLLAIEDLEKAENILKELGYQTTSHSFPRILNDWKWKSHHISYFHAEREIQIELHWRLNPETGMEPSFEELWDRRNVGSLTNKHNPVYYLGTEDLFLYLISHGARHGWFRLRWLTDIDRMLRMGIHSQNLIKLMDVYKCRHLVGQALVLSSNLLKTPVPDELKALGEEGRAIGLARSSLAFIKNCVNLCPDPTPDVARSYQRYLFSIKTTREKWDYRIKRLYPSSRDALALPLPRPLHFLYFPLRPFLWLWRQMRQQTI